MPRPKDGYRLQDGTKVPGVGDVIGRFKNSGALLLWAFNQGKTGAPSLYTKRDWAADVGTAVHDMIDLDLLGRTDEIATRAGKLDQEGRDKAMLGFSAWKAWRKQYDVRVMSSEQSLVSENHRYGGTLDKVVSINGGPPAILDFTTGKDFYIDHVLQVGAYSQLWSEVYPDRPLTGAHLLRCNRDTGEFEHRYFESLSDYLELFLWYRQAFDLDLQLADKRRLAGDAFMPQAAVIQMPMRKLAEAIPNGVPVLAAETDSQWLAARLAGFEMVRDQATFAAQEQAMLAGRDRVGSEMFMAAAAAAMAAKARIEKQTITGDFTMHPDYESAIAAQKIADEQAWLRNRRAAFDMCSNFAEYAREMQTMLAAKHAVTAETWKAAIKLSRACTKRLEKSDGSNLLAAG